MSKKITAFLPFSGNDFTINVINDLKNNELIENIFVISTEDLPKPQNTDLLKVNGLFSSETMNLIYKKSESNNILFLTKDTLINIGQFGLERFYNVLESTGAGIVYSDYYEIKDENCLAHPVNDYQLGSIRDDFAFGPLILFSNNAFGDAIEGNNNKFNFAGLYDIRLRISQKYLLIRIPEYLYSTIETDNRKSGEKMFDYVNPRNRNSQIEAETAATQHLKAINAFLEPSFKEVNIKEEKFPVEMSVIIPVKNRVKTISDAVNSVLTQKLNAEFNLIVIDNYSNDGTTEILKSISGKDKRLIHVVPQRTDLGIGGCWNEGVHHKLCGRYAVQLDSDDIYSDENTLQKILDVFYEEKCAMVVGSYKLTDFQLNEIPPGLIDHREWTPDNGRNNALRINGLGAPRAFYTPVLRNIKIPNVSYGEDYALGLAISREYQIGRIYDSIYICRRWEGNSDASLNVNQVNAHNLYKDRIRTLEILARQNKNELNR